MSETRRADESHLSDISTTWHNGKAIRNADFLERDNVPNLNDSGVYIPRTEQLPTLATLSDSGAPLGWGGKIRLI